jgi:hypothetical protein
MRPDKMADSRACLLKDVGYAADVLTTVAQSHNLRRQAVRESIMYVGLDVHKESIEIATADEGRHGEMRRYGRIDGELESLDRAVRKLGSTGKELRSVYEAGPCGYHLYRYLMAKGLEYKAVAPSRVPKKSGDRIKTTGVMQ